jgi:hypothetical protein
MVYASAFNSRHVVAAPFLGRYPWMSKGIEVPNVGGCIDEISSAPA